MLFLRRCANLSLLLLLLNAVPLLDMLRAPAILWAAVLIPLSAYYVFFNIRPRDDRPPTGKLKALISGYEQIWTAEVLVCVEIAFYVSNGFLSYLNTNLAALIIGAALCIALIWGILLVGFIRLFAASGQLGLALRAALILLWWAPGLNFILLHKARKTTGAEFDFSVKKHRLEKSREGAAYCETKYPLLLVHGIFFRDWERLSYWGRIPQALGRVGASVFYGGQQSSASLEASAAELAARIRGVLAQTGAEKVNIIAHSKGGLDARYAISRLGMGPQVASLTTVNTPHWGSALATKLMRVAPDLLLHTPELLAAVDAVIADLHPDTFLNYLPDLRHSFAALKPVETAALARQIAVNTGFETMDLAPVTDATTADLAQGANLELALRASLADDRLTDWVAP